jgi:indole-3-glycerol phosphate synthase
MTVTYLERIVDAHRANARRDDRSIDALVAEVTGLPPARDFSQALLDRSAAGDLVAVIAEVKRRSPSKGSLFVDLDAGDLARQYETGGAACLSVLTDQEFFGGSVADLEVARGATDLPVLRKDFTVDERDVCDARLMGADAVLLIVAALSGSELRRFHALARDLGLAALVEVHDEAELEAALESGADLIGVNQRDLVTFEVDTARAARLGASMPSDVVRIAESGIRGATDAAELAEAGYHAVLVGESLVTSGDPEAAVRALRRPAI